MNVHCISAAPEPELVAALTRFEEQFTYPLGPGRSFRISHGDDYPRFFRAIGDALCFVAERNGEILGVLCIAIAHMRTAEGSERNALYLGDLKVAPSARGGRVLVRLAEAARRWCNSLANYGFAVVMDGTPITPDRYTGRLGIPRFRAVANIAVLRIPATDSHADTEWEVDEVAGTSCYTRLSFGRISTHGGFPRQRSETRPQWLASPDGSACGRFEDTRRAKRLIADDGSEMIAGHLSNIGYANPAALAELLRVACRTAGVRGFPALFAAVPAEEANAILAALNEPGTIVAPATVFASGFEPNQKWAINTAEI